MCTCTCNTKIIYRPHIPHTGEECVAWNWYVISNIFPESCIVCDSLKPWIENMWKNIFVDAISVLKPVSASKIERLFCTMAFSITT